MTTRLIAPVPKSSVSAPQEAPCFTEEPGPSDGKRRKLSDSPSRTGGSLPSSATASASTSANVVEVRSLSLGTVSDGEEVCSFRVFSSMGDYNHALGLMGRFEKKQSGMEFPGWVEDRISPEARRPGYRLVTTVSTKLPYVVIRRTRSEATEFVKYFSSASEGYREARIHEYMHSRFPDHVVAVVESGTVGFARGAGKRVPPPCLSTDCPDIEFYIVTKDVGDGFVPASSVDVVKREDVREYVMRMLSLLLDMRVQAGFTHWDLHGNNFFYNSRTGTFRILDFGFGAVYLPRSASTGDAGTCLLGNNLTVPEAVLQDFDGDKAIFGFYYDVGRVMLHSSLVVRDEVLRFHGVGKQSFKYRYKKIVFGRWFAKRPRRSAASDRETLDLYYVARFALEACIEYPWLPKMRDTMPGGVGPPLIQGKPFPRLLSPVCVDHRRPEEPKLAKSFGDASFIG